MALQIEVSIGLDHEPMVRLLGDGCELGRRTFAHEHDFAAWESARVAMDLHNQAVVRERAARMPGVLPLPPDHVPAEEHFMVAVRLLFPAYSAASPASSPSPARS